MNPKLKIVLHKSNIIRPICTILVGKEHKTEHRLLMGTVVMLTGVVIAKYFGHHDNRMIALVGDALGYGMHGIGLLPVVDLIVDLEG